MTAYYNEFDPKAAAWLRELVAAGHIAPGDVDERDIRDVSPDELRRYDQCHFFAGIGGWSLALRRAGWADDRPVWTGSCPCQPFSAAGKRGGTADERHLWPAFYHLIEQCRPPVVFGEQVASKDGLGWFDLVSADLEGSGYAVGAADLCAAGLGAPHIRQRLWFVGVADADRRQRGRLADGEGCQPDRASTGWIEGDGEPERGGAVDPLEHASGDGRLEWRADAAVSGSLPSPLGGIHRGQEGAGPGPVNGFWRDADWLYCRDGKRRPVEPGTFPLAHGVSGRVGLLRGYGNAIVPAAAQAFIEATLEAIPEWLVEEYRDSESLDDVQRLRLMSGLEADVFG